MQGWRNWTAPEKPLCSLGQSSPLLQLGRAGAVLPCTPPGAGHGTSASPLSALSALSNARLIFFFFIFFSPSLLRVYISKKWPNVNVRFHLLFWEQSDAQVRLRERCRGARVEYRCEQWLGGWRDFSGVFGGFCVWLELLINQCLFFFPSHPLPRDGLRCLAVVCPAASSLGKYLPR